MPEKREERTTEGGLDVVGRPRSPDAHRRARLVEAGIRVSMFIDPDTRQLDAARALGAPVVELHTGAYCEAEGATRAQGTAAALPPPPPMPRRSGLECHAGHGLTYDNVGAGRRHSHHRRAQYRPFPDRRGDLRRARRRHPADARADGRGARMILGLGSDLIDIRRIEKTHRALRRRFLDRIFTAIERAKSDRRANRAASYAKRFAAKEACSKALGTGLRRGVYLARYRGRQSAGRQADPGADRRRAGAAQGA